ncbi:GC-rich sequence DNA-binding factor-like protein domain-containing protein [Ditylenchus destructor]|uniref:GC-rich sequence DNA-binding factor-like protein domain-containing protein n=1 Tax=Ditylenchus destructor TaxID=166010 RepID=A0AAD4NAK4_9BILA|nr:GC-rich sequence DNA-binding factor-like protein domain-containing protein [Ditylenchus destructor]
MTAAEEFMDWQAEDERPGFSGNSFVTDYSASISFVSSGIQISNTIQGNESDEVEVLSNTMNGHGSSPNAQQGTDSFVNTSFQRTNFAEWTEKSGKGDIIKQMMQKMGYVHGKGLGVNQQGIVEPIEPKSQIERTSIGYYESKHGCRLFRSKSADINTFAMNAMNKHWKNSNDMGKSKIRYKSLDDERNFGSSQEFGTKVIDLTGPEEKVYNDFGSYAQRTKGNGTRRFAIPDLTYNLSTLMDITEQEIVKNERELRCLKDQTFMLQQDKRKLENQTHEVQKEIDHMKDIVNIIRGFQRNSSQSGSSLDECKCLIAQLRSNFAVEHSLFGLDDITAIVLPILKRYFAEWDPLDPNQAENGIEMLKEWKEVIRENRRSSVFGKYKRKSDTISAFDLCIWEAWMPKMRQTALSWNPSMEGRAMMNLVKLWLPFLPKWIGENLLEQVLVPRIKDEVEKWNPGFDTIPIDLWLLPWHNIIGERLVLVYSTVRHKLGKALRNWAPETGDGSAMKGIRQWKDVFTRSSMKRFLTTNIVPKLERALRNIDISTTKPFIDLDLFGWMDMIDADMISQMLAGSFFPRFHDYLRMCLHGDSSRRMAKSYYKMWKKVLPKQLIQMESVKGELTKALHAIANVKKAVSSAHKRYHEKMYI